MANQEPALSDVLDEPSALSGVLRKYGATWQIVHDAGVGVWTAVQRPTPTALRVICAYDLASLAVKLDEIGRAHVRTPVTSGPRMPSSARKKKNMAISRQVGKEMSEIPSQQRPFMPADQADAENPADSAAIRPARRKGCARRIALTAAASLVAVAGVVALGGFL